MKKILIFSIVSFSFIAVFGYVLLNQSFATGYCPGYSASKGIAQCYCYPLSVTATNDTNACTNGKTTSVTVNWNGANCAYCTYTLHWTDNGASKTTNWTNSCPDNKSDPAYANNQTTITGTDITGSIGVAPLNQGSQITSDTPNQCPAPTTPTPTNSPTPAGPTATPTPGPHTKAKVVLLLPAVGGKNGGNASPGRPTRNVTLYFYQADQDPSDPSITPITRTGTVHLDTTTGSGTYGYFINTTLDIGGLNGTYKVLVKSNQYLRKQFVPKTGDNSQTYVFTPGQTTVLPTITLLAGDIVPPPTTAGGDYGDNTIDISDYNMLARGCYGGKATTSSCANKEGADLNDDGKVDGIDYNILIRTFNILANQGTQGGDGE